METARALVIGLGNPGIEYQRTRHNAGFAVLGILADRHSARFRRSVLGPRAETAHVVLGAVDVLLVRPLTYMNLSGEAVRPLVRKAGYTEQEILMVYDDMDIPFGRVRVRPGGSPAGHKGAGSVIAVVGTDRLPRIRIGIGRPHDGVDTADFVLAPVSGRDRPEWDRALERAADAVEVAVLEGVEAAMNRFNGGGGS